jgi:hypothetical protein
VIKVQYIWIHGVGSFHYFTPQWDITDDLSSDLDGDYMQKIHPREVDVPTYHFEVNKNVIILSDMVMFRVHHGLKHVLFPFHYFTPRWYLSNDLSSNPNRDRMQKLRHWEVDVPTYHLGDQRTIGDYLIGSKLEYTIAKYMVRPFFLF